MNSPTPASKLRKRVPLGNGLAPAQSHGLKNIGFFLWGCYLGGMKDAGWLIDWAKVAKLAIFAAVMYGIYYLVNFLFLDIGWWTILPWAAFWLLIAGLIDSRDRALARQREQEDHQSEQEPW